MPLPKHEVRDANAGLHRTLKEELGVNLFGPLLESKLAAEAAKQAERFHKAAIKGRHRDSDALYLVNGRISCINWQCSSEEDPEFANEIANLTGVNVGKVLEAGRALLKTAGYECTTELHVFQTDRLHSIGLHLDNEQVPGFKPDGTFLRDFAILRGQRTVKLAASKEALPYEVTMKAGEGYSLPALATYHAVDYSDNSLALYVQNRY